MDQSHNASAQPVPLDKQRAFVLLFRGKTYEAVWSWLRRLGVPRRDRMDIAQDVFLAGYQSFPNYDPLRARPERWLNRITVHVAAHYRDRAHHRREEFTSEDEPGVADERPDAEAQIDAEETRTLVLARLERLSPGERAILIEHDLQGLPMQTIAARHGLPLSTAYKWRTRALEELRALLEEHHLGGRRRRPPPPRGDAPEQETQQDTRQDTQQATRDMHALRGSWAPPPQERPEEGRRSRTPRRPPRTVPSPGAAIGAAALPAPPPVHGAPLGAPASP